LSLGLEATVDAPSTAGGTAGSMAHVLSWGVGVVPCVHVRAIFGCAIASLDWFVASGSGVRAQHTGTALIPAAGARAGFEVPLGASFVLRVHGDLLANLEPLSVDLNAQQAWRLPVVGGDVAAGLAFRFP
jgi:hypothetical protein